MSIDLNTIYPLLSRAKWGHTGYIKALCPFHDDLEPSLLVNVTRYKCMGCGHSGKTENLYKYLTGGHLSDTYRQKQWQKELKTDNKRMNVPAWCAENLQALEELAMNAHITMVNYRGQYEWYMRERGLADRIEAQMIGWYKNWYTIPVFDREHNFQGMVFRSSGNLEQHGGERFYIPAGQKPMMYVPDWILLQRAKIIFVVYGVLDALSLCELRLPAVTTTGGCESFDPVWLDDIRKPIVVVPDLGEEAAARELANGLGWRGKVALLPYTDGLTDPNDYLRAGMGVRLLRQLGKYA